VRYLRGPTFPALSWGQTPVLSESNGRAAAPFTELMARKFCEVYYVHFRSLVPVWGKGVGEKEDGHQVDGCIPTAHMF